MTEASKKEVRKCLIREAISAGESATDSDHSDQDTSSDKENRDDQPRRPRLIHQKRRIFVKPLSWRSHKYTEMLQKLDRKSKRRASPTSKAMERHRHEGATINCEPPEGAFDWMIKQH